MNIAICDDETIAIKNVEDMIDTIFEGTDYDYKCDAFDSGEALLKYIGQNPNTYQIYLLDIEMPGINGIEVATAIRQQDENAIIIFITGYKRYMMDAFDVQAFHYITKPLDPKEAGRIIFAGIKMMENRNKLFFYKIQKTIYTIYQSQIQYIESRGRKLFMHTNEGETIEFYGSLSDTMTKLSHTIFARAHNSYIVNMEKIKKADGKSIVMPDNQEIKISPKYYNSFHTAYRKFVLTTTT